MKTITYYDIHRENKTENINEVKWNKDSYGLGR